MPLSALLDGFGPVTARRDGEAVVASMHGVPVTATEDGRSIRLSHRAELDWSAQVDVDRLLRVVAAQTLSRPALTAASIDDTGEALVVEQWVPAEADAHALALAVRDLVATVGAVVDAAVEVGVSVVPVVPTVPVADDRDGSDDTDTLAPVGIADEEDAQEQDAAAEDAEEPGTDEELLFEPDVEGETEVAEETEEAEEAEEGWLGAEAHDDDAPVEAEPVGDEPAPGWADEHGDEEEHAPVADDVTAEEQTTSDEDHDDEPGWHDESDEDAGTGWAEGAGTLATGASAGAAAGVGAVAPDVDQSVAPDVDDTVAPDVDDTVAPDVDDTVAPDVDDTVAPDVDELPEDDTEAADAAEEFVETVWGYVHEEVEVRGLTETDQVIGHLRPGQWYAIMQTGNGWAHVVSSDGSLEGWVDDRRVIRND